MIGLLAGAGLRKLIVPGLIAAAFMAVGTWGWWQSTRADDAEDRAARLAATVDALRRNLDQEREAHGRELQEIQRVADDREARARDLSKALSAISADRGTTRDGPVAPVLRGALERLRIGPTDSDNQGMAANP